LSAARVGRPTAVVVDIEGTVGSIRFVKDVLVPFARLRLRSFVLEQRTRREVDEQLRAVAAETGRESIDAQIAELEHWSDEDRKATPLKALQGLIWQGGFASGELVGHLYDDAVTALKRWAGARLPVYVYSSGSVAAQKLYFAHSVAGDLSRGIAGYFDTTTGPKQEVNSYWTIAGAVGVAPADLLFFSDVAAELAAASAAGIHAVQVRRDPFAGGLFEPSITSFDQLPF